MSPTRHLCLVVFLLLVLAAFCVHDVQARRTRGVCSQPKVIGPCRAAFPRFYFDTSRRTCLPFIFGGCLGNDNNFSSMELCRRRCFLLSRRDTCQLPPRTGPCRARFTKFYYNIFTGRCQTFTYGGCLGNGNRFDTLYSCRARCGGT